jgi:hypothetical protein
MAIEEFEAFREVDRGPMGRGWTDLTAAEIEERDGPKAMERFALEAVAGAFEKVNGGEGFCDVRTRVLEQRDAMRLLKIAKLERMIEERDTAALRWRVKDREQLDNEARVSAARAMLLRARAELHSSSVGIRAVSAALSRA